MALFQWGGHLGLMSHKSFIVNYDNLTMKLFVLTLLMTVLSPHLFAEQLDKIEDAENVSAKYQLTFNRQEHSAFSTKYPDFSTGNGLSSGRDAMYTTSATAHWGFRAWEGGELYFDPEMVTGVPFTGALVGLGAFTNGEITRAAGPKPTFYRQRLFLRETWGQGGEQERVDSDFNQLSGYVDHNRVVLTVGNFSSLDVFDNNSYAKDPRTQFQNWGNWTYAAYDYAADARGYGWGFAAEWYHETWVYRIGRMSTPVSPNVEAVDLNLLQHYGDQFEVEHSYKIAERDGTIRLLLYHDRAVMASFNDATAGLMANYTFQTGPTALIGVRASNKDKYGVGVNLEQSIDPNIGLFLRAMKSDGKTETLAFTEVDSSLSTGVLVNGAKWQRPDDSFGMSLMVDWISADRLRFLEAGGVSFFIGDGTKNFHSGSEQILETFYSYGFFKNNWLTLDWQYIKNPAYNADRGPVNVFGARYHVEF